MTVPELDTLAKRVRYAATVIDEATVEWLKRHPLDSIDGASSWDSLDLCGFAEMLENEESVRPPGRFRQRPVEIEAMRFDGTALGAAAIADWMGHPVRGVGFDGTGTPHRMAIETPEGTLAASAGDWVVRYAPGKFYPCKPGVFAATHEEISTPEQGSCLECGLAEFARGERVSSDWLLDDAQDAAQTTALTVRLPTELADALKNYAFVTQTSGNEVIRRALVEYLTVHGRPEAIRTAFDRVVHQHAIALDKMKDM